MSQPAPVPDRREPVAILGYHDGGAGQVASWFEEVTGWRIACFVVEQDGPLVVDAPSENRRRVSQRTAYPADGQFLGRPLWTRLDWPTELLRQGIRKVLPLTPDNRTRWRQIHECQRHGLELVSAIHPTATILGDAHLAPGVWINARCVVGYKAELASGVILNTGAQIDHHNVLELACQVDPAVVTAGFVTLRECCHVHTGATIINRLEIGADSIIGAGAVVIASIPARSTAVGVPAKVIKSQAAAHG